jgi:transposase
MCAKTLVSDPTVITIERIVPDDNDIVLVARTRRCTVPCPLCERPATRVHSWYTRSLRDLPWQGLAVRMELHTRRWFCDNPRCPRQIFTERLPTVAAPFSQRTTRLATIVLIFGVAVGGAPGARLLAELGIPINGVTLLRAVMATTLPTSGAPRVLGVDDWCRRKGRTYGTILVDMEEHRPLDLLLGREAAPLAEWLGEHSAVETICRDRAGAYADGARQGAPDAIQVADRWHLLKNLGEALERLMRRHHPALTQVARTLTEQARVAALQAIEADSSDAFPAQPSSAAGVLPCQTRTQQDQQQRRDRRLARYEAVLDLHRQGLGVRAIARQMHIGRRVVRQYLAAPSFPERAPNGPRRTLLTPYEPYLRMRWEAGCQNAATLWRELRTQGFTGTESFVRQQVRHWRVIPGQPGRPARTKPFTERDTRAVPPPIRVLSPRQAVWLFLRGEVDLTTAQRAYRTELLHCCADIATAVPLVEEFQRLVRTRDAPALTAWLSTAATCDLGEFREFAAGLRRDYAAVEAAATSEWSSGQVEGQITRLKLVKRSMYGRAGFPLLRQRFLLAGSC